MSIRYRPISLGIGWSATLELIADGQSDAVSIPLDKAPIGMPYDGKLPSGIRNSSITPALPLSAMTLDGNGTSLIVWFAEIPSQGNIFQASFDLVADGDSC